MTAHADDIDPAEAMLAQLAGLDLTLARHLHACAMSADDPHATADLARAYHKIARSVRLTLAMHGRLKRERLSGQAPPLPPSDTPPPVRDPARAAKRKAEVRAAVRRVIRAEREAAETDAEPSDVLLERLEKSLEHQARNPAFGLELIDTAWRPMPLDRHVLLLCRGIGLPDEAAAAWRDLPEAEAFESSA